VDYVNGERTFKSVHSRNRFEVTVILDFSEANRIASVYRTIHFTIPYNVAIAATILHNVVYLTVYSQRATGISLTLRLSLSSSCLQTAFFLVGAEGIALHLFPRGIVHFLNGTQDGLLNTGGLS
jgi:hypothetical protein